ncbi:hypothetical protein Amn_18820 [Aminobacter sp. Y103A]|uniref:hypothetical protein n=1 Tax=Aminobacter sp. Y103A TaxID=1870862 RepID=UPI0025730756|nr:hypothetical protein [Aminobacter sp. SS-2016]BBD37002.1 hypothetical protein Amn_18820 [Aminobacter sp. SS-2016]
MPSTTEAVDAVVRLGFDPGRAKAVARSLTDAAVLPSGGPGKSPALDVTHFIDLLIGVVVDAPLRLVPAAVRSYRALTPGGADLANAPASIDTAGQALDIFADIALHGEHPDLLRRDQIEIVSSWSEIALISPSGIRRFVPVGANAAHWAASGHRKSTTIAGSAFVDAVRDLFAKE